MSMLPLLSGTTFARHICTSRLEPGRCFATLPRIPASRRFLIDRPTEASFKAGLVSIFLYARPTHSLSRAKIPEEAASIGNQANCSRFCANPNTAIITTHTKFALAEEKCLGKKETVSSASAAGPQGREGGRGTTAEKKKSEEGRQRGE